MAHLFQSEMVRYVCWCGSLKPLSRIYFCRHCLRIRCGGCVSHEVDSHYCPNCLENMPSAEARLKKNRCANCFDCPSCLHTLSTRASTLQVASPSASGEETLKTAPKKVYYLACSFCRWTSRDVGIKDQAVASGGWGEAENPHAARISSLLDHYRALAQREKVDKERRRFHPRRPYLHFSSDKFGLTSSAGRKRMGASPGKEGESGASSGESGSGASWWAEPAEASEEVEPLAPQVFELPLKLSGVSSLEQRLAQPESQAPDVWGLAPPRKHLMIKRSQRCATCEHNLSKPEYNPTSIKFKIQLAAFYHVPEVRVVRCDALSAGKESVLVVKISNPSPYPTSVALLPLVEEEEEGEQVGEKEICQVSCPIPHIPNVQRLSCQALLLPPSAPVMLPAKDDAAEYDDFGDAHSFQDDPKVVVWRKANKAAVQVGVRVAEGVREEGEGLSVGVRLAYEYVNTVAALEQREPQRLGMEAHLFLFLGSLQDAAP